jgi:hypothetical protein
LNKTTRVGFITLIIFTMLAISMFTTGYGIEPNETLVRAYGNIVYPEPTNSTHPQWFGAGIYIDRVIDHWDIIGPYLARNSLNTVRLAYVRDVDLDRLSQALTLLGSNGVNVILDFHGWDTGFFGSQEYYDFILSISRYTRGYSNVVAIEPWNEVNFPENTASWIQEEGDILQAYAHIWDMLKGDGDTRDIVICDPQFFASYQGARDPNTLLDSPYNRDYVIGFHQYMPTSFETLTEPNQEFWNRLVDRMNKVEAWLPYFRCWLGEVGMRVPRDLEVNQIWASEWLMFGLVNDLGFNYWFGPTNNVQAQIDWSELIFGMAGWS